MKILISIFFALVLAFWTSKLKINVQYLKKEKNSSEIKFHVNIGIYLLGLIKIFGITLKEDGIHFLDLRFAYPVMKIDQESMKIFKRFSIIDILKSLHLKLDKFHFALQIGTEDVMLTVFLVFVISTLLSVLSAKNSKRINLKNYGYQITPIYNKNTLSFKSAMQISIPIVRFIKAFLLVKKQTKSKKANQFHTQNDLIKI